MYTFPRINYLLSFKGFFLDTSTITLALMSISTPTHAQEISLKDNFCYSYNFNYKSLKSLVSTNFCFNTLLTTQEKFKCN